MYTVDFNRHLKNLNDLPGYRLEGRVTRVVGLVVGGIAPMASIGNICEIHTRFSKVPIKTEVVGFKEEEILLMPLGAVKGISKGDTIYLSDKVAVVKAGKGLLGRVINGLGVPLDGKGSYEWEREFPIYNDPINPLERTRITEPLDIGVRALNGLLTCGKGQRMGIFAAAGVGKSILMGMIARNTKADINVVALIGERGREVNDFIEKSLGEEGLKRSIVIVATSDQPALVRIRAAFLATAIAEYFREEGYDTLLMMDSITRFAMAQREVGLSIGEPPSMKGYTPSVFTLLPKLMERAGSIRNKGSITGIYTILVEGGDMNEPIADTSRSILDGHIILSKELASKNHYPAIDILNSISRVMIDSVSKEHMFLANKLREVLSIYKGSEDLIDIGAYVKGSNEKIDYSLSKIDIINSYLMQAIYENSDMKDCIDKLVKIFQ